MRKSKKQKLNYKQNLTETNVKRLFLHLKRDDELNRKHLQQRKIKKFNYLKFKPRSQCLSEENQEIIHTEKRTKEHYKPSSVIVLKRRSNTNLRRKFSKQNLAENEQNNSIKNSILNASRSHSTSRNTPTKVPAAKQNQKQQK